MELGEQLGLLIRENPTVFGGCYMDGSRYIVLVVRGADAQFERAPTGPEVIYVDARFSWAELEATWLRIHQEREGGAIPFYVTGYGIIDEHNRVVVWLDELTPEAADFFGERYGDIVELVEHGPLDELSSRDALPARPERSRRRERAEQP